MAFCSKYICHKMNCRSYAHYLLEVIILFGSVTQWYYTTNFYFDMGSGNSTCYSEAQSDDKDEFKKPNAPSARVLTRRESCLSTYRWANQHELMWHGTLRNIHQHLYKTIVYIFTFQHRKPTCNWTPNHFRGFQHSKLWSSKNVKWKSC